MQLNDFLLELYGRIPPLVERAVDGLDAAALRWRPPPSGNPVGWLTWHLTRVQDHHVAQLLDADQLWVDGPWAARFGLGPDPSNTGYGHDDADVNAVQPDGPSAITEYHRAVAARTNQYLGGLTADELDSIVDRSFDPPVTLGARLVSVAVDDLEHAGQAAYVRGLLDAG